MPAIATSPALELLLCPLLCCCRPQLFIARQATRSCRPWRAAVFPMVHSVPCCMRNTPPPLRSGVAFSSGWCSTPAPCHAPPPHGPDLARLSPHLLLVGNVQKVLPVDSGGSALFLWSDLQGLAGTFVPAHSGCTVMEALGHWGNSLACRGPLPSGPGSAPGHPGKHYYPISLFFLFFRYNAPSKGMKLWEPLGKIRHSPMRLRRQWCARECYNLGGAAKIEGLRREFVAGRPGVEEQSYCGSVTR